MSLYRRADEIRLVAVRLGQGELKSVTQEPGVHEAVRISIYYHDGRAPSSVATLRRVRAKECSLQVAYDKTPEPVRFNLNVDLQRYQDLLMAWRKARFDQLDDQPDVPFYGADLWLVERAAGSFYHDIVISPELAGGNYREIVLSTRRLLPEAVRQGVS